jgi:hypothetical protein
MGHFICKFETVKILFQRRVSMKNQEDNQSVWLVSDLSSESCDLSNIQ